MTSPFELHPDRLGTTDQEGRRVFLHPADVAGFFRRWRTWTQAVLILVFLTLPWIQINGRQAVLLNLADRHFEIFGLTLKAHNAPLLILVLAAAAFGLFFVTAVWGRIWCGWACPQTVFIDGVFRRIERWIEGPALERRRLDAAKWSPRKILKRSLKWFLFLAVSLILTHSFLAYFVGTEKLSEMIQRSPLENRGDFLFMIVATGLILFDFAWFREQFCTLVCPYGRFQSVIMDKASLVVSYDSARGEPRHTQSFKALAKTTGEKIGDCVNCYRCVQVCPTGIDIRRGLQMECIACTACIDACDDVMTKVNKPTGLIKYDSLVPNDRNGRRINSRALVYLSLCLISVGALTYIVSQFKPLAFEILRAKGSPYTTQTRSDGLNIVVNHFRIELVNQSKRSMNLNFGIATSDLEATRPTVEPPIELVTAFQPLVLSENKIQHVDVFVRFSQTLLVNGQSKIRIYVTQDEPIDGHEKSSEEGSEPVYVEKEVTLVGPFS